MRVWQLVVGAILVWLGCAVSASAEKRVALVIGNDIYRNLPEREQLHNAVNDARAVRTALAGLGFEVMPVAENLDRAALVGRLSDFAAKLEPGDIAFFFYAGHGVSLNGANYLLPTDIPPPRATGRAEEDRLAELSVPETSVSDRIRRSGARIAVVVLDACRDNPLAASGGRSVGVSRGLAPPPETRGVLSIYSAGTGQQAMDRLNEADTAANSVFTRVFVKKLTTPGLGLRAAAFETQGEVAALAIGAGQEQVPGVYSQIIGEDVYLAGREAVAVPVVTDVQGAEFQAAMQAGTVAALDGFEGKYRTGALVEIARRERDRLAQVAALPTPPVETVEQIAKDAADQARKQQLARELASLLAAERAARERQQVALQEAEIAQRERDLRLKQQAALPPLAIVPATPPPHAARRYALPDGASLVPQPNREGGYNSVALSPDGRSLVSGSDDKMLKLWDMESGKLLRSIAGHNYRVFSTAFSPDGRSLVSAGGDDGTLKLWDVASGGLLRSIAGHSESGWVGKAIFSPDGRTLASIGDKTPKLWDAASGRLLRSFAGHRREVFAIAFAPDGRSLVTGGVDTTLKLWETASGKLLRTLAGHGNTIDSIAFSPDGSRFVSASRDNAWGVWDAASGKQLGSFSGTGGTDTSVAFSPDGRSLVSAGGDDETLKLWDVASGKLLRQFDGHLSSVRAVAFSPNGFTLVSGSQDSTVKLWDTASGALLATFFSIGAQGVAYTPDGVFVTDADPRAAFKIMRGGQELPLDDFIALNRRASLLIGVREALVK